nr:cobaltochelatase subunit CobN [Clostridia bacterium]
SLYGVLDNDDVYQYLGGLKLAAEAASGKGVETYIANTRNAGGPRIETLAEFVGMELRTRLLNPKWIEGNRFRDILTKATEQQIKLPNRERENDAQAESKEAVPTTVVKPLPLAVPPAGVPSQQPAISIQPAPEKMLEANEPTAARTTEDKIVEVTGSQAGAGDAVQANAETGGDQGELAKSKRVKAKAYEIEMPQKQQSQSSSMPTGVTVFAILGALVLVAVFAKGYLTR